MHVDYRETVGIPLGDDFEKARDLVTSASHAADRPDEASALLKLRAWSEAT